MTGSEHLREHLRTPSSEKHLRTSGAPTPEHRTAGQSTYGSTYGTYGTYAPEHLRPPPFLDEGVACSTPSMTPRLPMTSQPNFTSGPAGGFPGEPTCLAAPCGDVKVSSDGAKVGGPEAPTAEPNRTTTTTRSGWGGTPIDPLPGPTVRHSARDSVRVYKFRNSGGR